MKKLLIFLISISINLICLAQSLSDYKPLDTKNPIVFEENHIVYKGEKIELGPKAFFICGQFTEEQAAQYNYVFNSINEASKFLTDGSEESPMVLYIAPYVYWIDNPDDPEIRVPKPGQRAPFGLEINCEWLKFYGLSDDAKNVVLASNRGQTMGAKGNFTMFKISGKGTSSENITFGNYCNIDLEFPLKPELNREKRGSAIVQAQLIFCNGDKIVARNTRFVSRLNLCPFIGGKRVLFNRCHFESTDDALNGTAVYLNCTLDFYSGKPFWGAFGTGAVFLNCDIKSFTRGKQFFTKSRGQMAVVDTRFESETLGYLGWRDFPAIETPNYQYNVLLNGEPVFIGKNNPESTIEMAGKKILDAYRFEYNGKIIYNTYNLLHGNDDWDPMGIKKQVLAVEKETGKSFTNLATQLVVTPSRDTIETGKETTVLHAKVNRFGNYESAEESIKWIIAPEYESFVDLEVQEDGSCKVIPTNQKDWLEEVIIKASSSDGLHAASVLYIAPPVLNAPKFIRLPEINSSSSGKLKVDYQLDSKYTDQSLVSWFRCSDSNGNNPIEIKVSRMNQPKLDYVLSAGDIGYFIKVVVAPKNMRSNPGASVSDITKKVIAEKEVSGSNKVLVADFKNRSTKYQPEVKPGFWSLDSYAPTDTHEFNWDANNNIDSWYYGVGVNGAANDTGLVQANKGARLRYTPIGKKFGDMKISFTAVPAKTAGQGFSSARAQYMDICIKFDTETLSGYALRLIRTTKYSDAIDCILMKYENGNATAISESVSTSCYRADCFISVEVKGNKLIARAESPTEYRIKPGHDEVVKVVNMETEIIPGKYGGFSIQHTGTVGSGATLIKDLRIEW